MVKGNFIKKTTSTRGTDGDLDTDISESKVLLLKIKKHFDQDEISSAIFEFSRLMNKMNDSTFVFTFGQKMKLSSAYGKLNSAEATDKEIENAKKLVGEVIESL